MAKRNYKTLRGLLSQTLYGQMNFIDFHWNRFYHHKHGWMEFSLPEPEKNKGYRIMAEWIYSKNIGEKANLMKSYRGRQHGILKSILLYRSGKGGFCAGQDYNRDIRVVHGIFRNGD